MIEDRSVEFSSKAMPTVKEFIEVLSKYPEDTPVAVTHQGIEGVLDIENIFDNRRYGNDNDMVIIDFKY